MESDYMLQKQLHLKDIALGSLRNPDKAKAAIESIISHTGNDKIDFFKQI